LIVLASRSPRRAELLAAAGFAFDVHAVDIDERPRPDELPEAYVERLAIEKAQAVFAKLMDKPKGLSPPQGEGLSPPDLVVLGADTTVIVDGRILGKPGSRAEAIGMLNALNGRAHDVFTGVATVSPDGVRSGVERTRVWFDAMTDEDISWYVDSGEPMDRAGGYAIQGLASRFIPRIEGSYTNVVGRVEP
jgi:septum formation protein